MKDSLPPRRFTRAGFFQETWRGIASLIYELIGDSLDVIEKAFPEVIRPPGAVPEGRFLQLCTRCGACRQACPFFAIRPIVRLGSFDEGTPQIQPPETWCRMCSDLPCARACPTGALQIPANLTAIAELASPAAAPALPIPPDQAPTTPPTTNDLPPRPEGPLHRPPSQNEPLPTPTTAAPDWPTRPNHPSVLAPRADSPTAPPPARIGLAEVVPARCLRLSGTSCTACLTACPTRFRAVALPDPGRPPVIDAERCCGCGACSAICPAAPTRAIRITARDR